MEICFSNLATSNQYVKSFIVIAVLQNPTGGKVWRLVFPTVNHIPGIALQESTPSKVGFSVCSCIINASSPEEQSTPPWRWRGAALAVKRFCTHLSHFKTCECLGRDP